MMQYRTLTHNQIILLLCTWIGGVLAYSGIVGGTQKTDIIHPVQKVAMKSDSYGGHKFISNICSSDYEAKNLMGRTS